MLQLLTGCAEPPADFEAFKLPRPINMAQVLGNAPLLLGPQDTLMLRLRFDAATGYTEFSLQEDSTTHSWFIARAFRFRKLYYLVEERQNARYWVHAVRIRRGQVQGLGTGYRQMLDLSQAAWQGHWPQLLASNGDSMQLRFNRQQLRKFYTEEVDRFTTYRLATTSAGQAATPSADLTPTQSMSLYPNPASTSATVVFKDTAAHLVQLYDERGRLLQSYATTENQLSFPVANLPAGTYLVRTRLAANGATLTLRLAVTH
ncbi:hypothetical protein Hsw_3632 [Hymenobacter swuensis DY53]|uniref:Secretion system C-terminal sorting domain-containing protein n=2 Tax=Hymenobacter TaxID=89966 RepID=W8F5B1_9BACT|nr:hypothetical protein Hsw_3632 [Hymenobacter swuensis DY53]